MFIVVYQSIVLCLCPHLLFSFVFLIVVRRCHPSSSSFFVLVVVRHPPHLRRQGWRAIHPNIMWFLCLYSLSSILVCCPLLFSPLLSSPLRSAPLLSTPLHSSPLRSAPLLSGASELTITSSPYTPATRIIPLYHQSIVPSSHHTIEPFCHTIMIIAWIQAKPEQRTNGEEEEILR